MAVSAAYDLKVSVTETGLTFGSELISNTSLLHEQTTRAQGTLTADSVSHTDGTTVVPATKVYSDQVPLAAGAATVDFTTLLDYAGTAMTFDTLNIQLLFIENDQANANNMVFVDGLTNPYFFLTENPSSMTLAPGQSILIYGNDAMPAIANASVEQIDVSGTGAQFFNIIAVAG